MQKFYDLARVFSSTTGTSSLLLGNAVPGFLTFADAGAVDGDGVTYCIRDGSNSEIGRGTLSLSAGLWYLARTTVLQSTNADAKISCTGAQEVFITLSSMDIADLKALVTGTAQIGSWKRWRVRNIINAASSPYTHINKLRFKLSGVAATPDSVEYSDNAVSPASLFAGTGDWHCLGPGWIEAVWTTAQAFDQVALEATTTSYGASSAYPPVGLEIWVSNDGFKYYPITVIDQLLATIGTSGNTINLPTTWPWSAGSGGGSSLPTGGTAGQILTKQSSTDGDAAWADNSKALSQLTDVNLATPSDGQFLLFDNATGKWVNLTKHYVEGSAHSVLGSTAHRYWRLYNMHSAGSNVSFNEIRFYQALNGSPATISSAVASSEFNGSLVAANTIDSNLNTGWASTESGASSTAWIKFDLGSPTEFVQIWMAARTDGFASQCPNTFTLQYSDDGTTWTTQQVVTFATAWTTNGQQQVEKIYKAGYGIGVSNMIDANVSGVADGDVLYWDNTTSTWLTKAIHGIPTGGTAGQVLTKNSSTNYDASWATPSGGGGGSTLLRDRVSAPTAGGFSTLLGTNSVNPTITNASDTSCVFDFGASPAGGDNNRLALKSAPSTPWTLTARLEVSLFDYNYSGGGLYLRNSTSGKLVSWGANGGGSSGLMQFNEWNSQTSFSSTPFSMTPLRNTRWQWFKIINDGTNLEAYLSIDGNSWIKCGVRSLAAFISSVDQIGFGMQISHGNTYPTRTQDASSQAWPVSGTSEGFVHVYYYAES